MLFPYVVVLDALMVVLAMLTLNFVNPWNFLYKNPPVESFRLVPTQRSDEELTA